MTSFAQNIENIYNEWIKQHPGVGDGGCVASDLESIHEILLLNLKEDIKIAEIGVWTGKTTLLLGKTIQPYNGKVYAIDWFQGQVQVEGHPTSPIRYTKVAVPANIVSLEAQDSVENVFRENMRTHNIEDCVELIKDSSTNSSVRFKDNFFDFIFVDASHDYQSVKEDLNTWYPKLKPGGIIAGHDFQEKMELAAAKKLWERFEKEFFNCYCHPGVIYAVMEKFPNVRKGLGRIWFNVKEKGEENG